MLTSKDPRLAGRVAFTHSNFVSYTLARFFIVVALEMQSVAVGWQVYEITRRPLDLGYVGLAQFAPGFVLFLFAGHAADLFDRRKLLMWCYGGFALCSALLLAISWRAPQSVHSIYVVLVLLGIFRCFNWPASRALLPQLVPEEHFANAVAWNASTFQIATIAGPAIGGLAYALFRGPEGVYAVAVIVSILSTIFTVRIHPLPASSEKDLAERVAEKEPVSLRTVLAGFRFIWEKKLILGSISLDMFAVLLGGAVALLPVAAFGGFTIVFGISTSLMLSLLALFLIGASDMVSVIIRATLVQVATPDEMRGRVNAVDMLFIGVSNELGEFESGLTAQWFGTVPAVVLGGVGTLLVIASWAWLFPELRQADQLTVAELVPK